MVAPLGVTQQPLVLVLMEVGRSGGRKQPHRGAGGIKCCTEELTVVK